MENTELTTPAALFEDAYREWYARVGRFIRIEGSGSDRTKQTLFRAGWDAREE